MKLFFSILFFASVAKADFTGDWTGEGIISGGGKSQTCSGLWVSLSQSLTELKISEVNYSCINVVFKSLVYEIRGQDLFEGNQKLGWIKKSEFYIFKKSRDQNLELHGEIRINKPTQKEVLTFNQDFVDKQSNAELHVKAHFERFVPPSP